MQEPRMARPPHSVSGPVVISLAAGIVGLPARPFVNGCQISRLLGRSTADAGGGSIVVTPPEVDDSALAGETVPRVNNLAVSGGARVAAARHPRIDRRPPP